MTCDDGIYFSLSLSNVIPLINVHIVILLPHKKLVTFKKQTHINKGGKLETSNNNMGTTRSKAVKTFTTECDRVSQIAYRTRLDIDRSEEKAKLNKDSSLLQAANRDVAAGGHNIDTDVGRLEFRKFDACRKKIEQVAKETGETWAYCHHLAPRYIKWFQRHKFVVISQTKHHVVGWDHLPKRDKHSFGLPRPVCELFQRERETMCVSEADIAIIAPKVQVRKTK
jgi:hypothetical protein